MGAYFQLIGIATSPAIALEKALSRLERPKGDSVEVFASFSEHWLIMPGEVLHDAAGVARHLSDQLSTACFLFSYSDDVVWGYDLFRLGDLMDSYSSRPNYFSSAAESELSRLNGNVDVVCACWPTVTRDSISGYLTNKEVCNSSGAEKAYAEDRFPAGDAWQLCDFMRKLGLEYPVDDNGEFKQEPLYSASIATELGLAEKTASEELLAGAMAKMEEWRLSRAATNP